MTHLPRFLFLAPVLLATAPVSAQTRDHAPVSLKSSSKMSQDKSGSESWTYAEPVAKFAKYRTVIVLPTKVYQGADAQFEGIEPADRNSRRASRRRRNRRPTL